MNTIILALVLLTQKPKQLPYELLWGMYVDNYNARMKAESEVEELKEQLLGISLQLELDKERKRAVEVSEGK